MGPSLVGLRRCLQSGVEKGARAASACGSSRSLPQWKALDDQRRLFFSTTHVWCGMEQLQDVPLSTSRKPRGFHRGPGKRQTSESEAERYRFIKKWDLQMREMWDDLEPFQGLPKPKNVLGNEACEVIWPYAILLEREVKLHPFTKSIYCYYSLHQATKEGEWAAKVAQAFSHGHLVPITFHNSHVYVETELLLEYSETPWLVIHCLDGRHRLLPVKPKMNPDTDENVTAVSAAASLLDEVVDACEALGNSVESPRSMYRLLNERPLQNQYLRIDYQWFGDTPEERNAHLVQWKFDLEDVKPVLRSRSRHIMNWLNYDGNLANAAAVHINVKREKARMQVPRNTGGMKSFFNASGSRANPRHSKFGGMPK